MQQQQRNEIATAGAQSRRESDPHQNVTTPLSTGKLPSFAPPGDADATTPQRPVRSGRGGKYYEVLYMNGMARASAIDKETTLGGHQYLFDGTVQAVRTDGRTDEDNVPATRQILDVQDEQDSELQPRPSVRRRRSRHRPLATQPTPPARRHRPGSMGSKESTPSRESPDVSVAEDLSSRERTAAQVLPLGIVFEHDAQDPEAVYHSVPAPVPLALADPAQGTAHDHSPVYDQPQAELQSPESEPKGHPAETTELQTELAYSRQGRSRTPSPQIQPANFGTDRPVSTREESVLRPTPSSRRAKRSPLIEVVPHETTPQVTKVQTNAQPTAVESRALDTSPIGELSENSLAYRDDAHFQDLESTSPLQEKLNVLAAVKQIAQDLPIGHEPGRHTELSLDVKAATLRQASPQSLPRQRLTPERQPSPCLNPITRLVSEQRQAVRPADGCSLQEEADIPTNSSVSAVPIVHREILDEPHLGTTSPESLKDWYGSREYPYEDDVDDQPLKRKPSKIIRKIQGLFEKKKPDDIVLNTPSERKRSDQLDVCASPREPTTPTKKSKLGQFFSFNRKEERRKSSPPPDVFGPAIQGPADIPEGMLAKLFISKLTEEKPAPKPRTPPYVRPVFNFRDWSPSTEDLTAASHANVTDKTSSPPKSSKYYVPDIPPFRPKPATPQQEALPTLKDSSCLQPKNGRLSPPDSGEVQNSPYSSCSDRTNAKTSTPNRRTSLASDDVEALYKDFLDNEKLFSSPDDQSGPQRQQMQHIQQQQQHSPFQQQEAPQSVFVRKPSTKAAAVPPELRAPLYRPAQPFAFPPVSDAADLDQPKPSNSPTTCPTKDMANEFKSNVKVEAEPQIPPLEATPRTNGATERDEEVPASSSCNDSNEPQLPERRDTIQELRVVFRNAWRLIRLMILDLFYEVPKEVWSELRVVLMFLAVMLLGLYWRGMIRFNGNSFEDLIKAFFRGLRVLLGLVLGGGLALYDTIDSMVSDASSSLVADTLKEI